MIITETVEINDRQFVHTYSDAGFKIARNNRTYDDAYDPVGLDRVYTETDIPIV